MNDVEVRIGFLLGSNVNKTTEAKPICRTHKRVAKIEHPLPRSGSANIRRECVESCLKKNRCLSLAGARRPRRGPTHDAKLSLELPSSTNYFNYLSDNRREYVYIQREKNESKIIFETYNENVEKYWKVRVTASSIAVYD